jgi:CheY-like chemotaxis protein
MFTNAKPVTFLIAEDDPDDRFLIKEAFQESLLTNSLYFVQDGVELLDYLRRQGKFANPVDAPPADLILLDLNMPRKDGREALAEIKSDPHLRYIPVVVLTTSKAEEDIMRSYDIGAAYPSYC